MRVKRNIALRRAPGNPREGRLVLSHGVRRAALGRSGIKALKREGDGATPAGRFPVRQVLYRADRVTRPRTVFPLRAIRADDGWCEDPTDRSYNRLVKLSPRSGADRLTRDDNLYDLILVLGHNDRPRVKGRGSAIFVHLARPGYAPTAGCIALAKTDLLALLAELVGGAIIDVGHARAMKRIRPTPSRDRSRR
jgi:L,D-peptidoglycan transpeptidase YkuD (ErfK/YbiS/YcfS/YnhG family)